MEPTVVASMHCPRSAQCCCWGWCCLGVDLALYGFCSYTPDPDYLTLAPRATEYKLVLEFARTEAVYSQQCRVVTSVLLGLTVDRTDVQAAGRL